MENYKTPNYKIVDYKIVDYKIVDYKIVKKKETKIFWFLFLVVTDKGLCCVQLSIVDKYSCYILADGYYCYILLSLVATSKTYHHMLLKYSCNQ